MQKHSFQCFSIHLKSLKVLRSSINILPSVKLKVSIVSIAFFTNILFDMDLRSDVLFLIELVLVDDDARDFDELRRIAKKK